MKRLTAMFLTMLMMIMQLRAYADGAKLTYERTVEMTSYLREIASGDYLTINGVPEDIQRTAREWAAGIHGEPRLIVEMDIMNSAFILQQRTGFITEHPMVIYEAESSAVTYLLNYMMAFAAMETVVSESMYEEITEVNNQLNCEMLYAEEAEEGTGMYLVFYEGAQPILILSSAESGAVSLRAFFIPSVKLEKCQNYGQVALWFMLNGLTITCAEVKP